MDQNYKVCVCDFGLTQAKPRDVSNLEYDPHGSPLYMAPEVFLGDYNEKCDVYSLGIVLWEMLVQKEAFEEVNQNLQTFVEAVCYNDFRPPIPQGIPQSLVDLMKRCWAKDPETRPTMAEIISSLHEIAVEAAINDANGRKFWKQFFMEKVSSPFPFSPFFPSLSSSSSSPSPSPLLSLLLYLLFYLLSNFTKIILFIIKNEQMK